MFLNPESSWPYLVTLRPCRVNIINCCQHLTGKKNCFFHKHVFVYYWTCPSRTCRKNCPDPDPVLSFLHPSQEIHSLVFGITQINNKINPSLNETFQTVWILWLLPVWLETDFTHKNTTRWLKCCADNIFFPQATNNNNNNMSTLIQTFMKQAAVLCYTGHTFT